MKSKNKKTERTEESQMFAHSNRNNPVPVPPGQNAADTPVPSNRNIEIRGLDATPGQYRPTTNEFATDQPPIEPVTKYVYLGTMKRTLSTIYGTMQDGSIASEYFITPKRARSADNVEHKVAGNNLVCLGNKARLANMFQLHMLQIVRREESFIFWDENGAVYNEMLPLLEAQNYKVVTISISAALQSQLCERIQDDSFFSETLDQLIDPTDLNNTLRLLSDTNPKQAIFFTPEKTESSKWTQTLFRLFIGHVYYYLINVGRTSSSRYFYWPVHILLPEIDVFDESAFQYSKLELARYRGSISMFGSYAVPKSVSYLAYRPVIKTAFINNCLILESDAMVALENRIEADLGIDIRPINAQTQRGKHYVRILTEQQIRAKRPPILVEELDATMHPLLQP